MAELSDTLDAIELAALDPLKAASDGQSAEAHPLSEQIAAAKFVAESRATANGKSAWRGRTARAITPGADPR